MESVTLRVTEPVFQLFPEAVLGVIAFRGIQNRGERPEVMAALRAVEARIRGDFASLTVSDHPRIAPWREAYRAFGVKPRDYPSSVEALVKRVAKGHALAHINTLVDLYNVVCLRQVVPVGGEDLDQIVGDVRLTVATDHEPPARMLGEPAAQAPRPGEVFYTDDVGAVCRCWNWREAERTKFTEQTRNGFLIVEGLPPVGAGEVQQALDELLALLQQYCGGEASGGLVDRQHPAFVLRPAGA